MRLAAVLTGLAAVIAATPCLGTSPFGRCHAGNNFPGAALWHWSPNHRD